MTDAARPSAERMGVDDTDLMASNAWADLTPGPTQLSLYYCSSAEFRLPDAKLTYLRTGRLRL